MKHNIFKNGLSILIVMLLIVMSFIRGPKQIWFLVGSFVIWAIYIMVALFIQNKPYIDAKLYQRKLRKQREAENAHAKQYNSKDFHASEVDDSPLNVVLLRHVNHRISAYLKSAYPNVTWEWVSEDPDQLVAEGGTGRIRLFNVPDFNYADIQFDRLARIDCDMLRIVPLSELGKSQGETVQTKAGGPVDPEVWYDIQGKIVLETCIAELNSQGHASLTISENGEIHIQQEQADVIHEKLQNFPGKNTWKQLVGIFEREGLAATASENGLKISW